MSTLTNCQIESKNQRESNCWRSTTDLTTVSVTITQQANICFHFSQIYLPILPWLLLSLVWTEILSTKVRISRW